MKKIVALCLILYLAIFIGVFLIFLENKKADLTCSYKYSDKLFNTTHDYYECQDKKGESYNIYLNGKYGEEESR